MGGPEWRARRFTTGWLVWSAVSVLVTTCVAPIRAVAQTAAAAVVEAREIAFAKTMADRDLDAFLTFVSPEAVFFAGNEPLRGRDAVARAWAPFFEGPVAPFSWHPDVVQVLDSGDLALSSGPVRGPDGEEVGRFNSIWRRDADGQWLVVFDKGS
jgi:ketosteroid isomerase-like protein